MVHAAMVASIASPIVTGTLTAVEQPPAPIAHPPYDLISPEAPEKREWREGPAQPFEKARFAEGKSLDFPSVRLGFSFPTAWIFLPPPRAEGELSGPAELDKQ
jgi:hypothetical protein